MTRSRAAHQADIEKMTGANLEAFQQGVQSVLRQWTVLELGIYHQWGGSVSAAEVYNEIYTQLMNLFFGVNKFYKDDILLLLEDYIEDKFSIICEDGSPEELSQVFVMLWNECLEGNHSSVVNIMAREKNRQQIIQQSQGLQDGDAMESDSDDDGDVSQVNQMYREQFQQALNNPSLDATNPFANNPFTNNPFATPAAVPQENGEKKKNNRRKKAVEATDEDWGDENQITGFAEMEDDSMQ